MEKTADIEPGEGEKIREKLEELLENLKLKKKVKNDAHIKNEEKYFFQWAFYHTDIYSQIMIFQT